MADHIDEAPFADPTQLEVLPEEGADREILATDELEARLLSALLWAPASLRRQIVDVLADRDSGRDPADDFWRPAHAYIFTHMVELTAAVGTDWTITDLNARLTAHGQRFDAHKASWLTIVSPAADRAWSDTAGDIAQLAAEVIEARYRRGYRAVAVRMQQLADDHSVSPAEFDAFATRMAGYRDRAQTRRLRRTYELEHLTDRAPVAA